MKIAIDISARVLREARAPARCEGISLQGVVERALRRIIDDAEQERPFRLRKASFKGKGLHPEARDAGWARLRAISYGGRGG